MSPATWNAHNHILPADPDRSPGERPEDEVGPGWTWGVVVSPYYMSTHMYRWSMFDTADQAVNDMVRTMQDTNPGRIQRPRAITTLRRLRRAGELVLCTNEGSPTFFVVIEVWDGQHHSDRFEQYYDAWAATTLVRQRRTIMSSRKPTVWT